MGLGRGALVAAEIRVPAELREPHQLVVTASRLLKRSGLRARTEVLATTRCLDVVVSPQQLDRALRILDTLIKAFEARGYEGGGDRRCCAETATRGPYL
jgi:hypothetical protein